MKDYMVIHRYIEGKNTDVDKYRFDVVRKCDSSKHAIVEYVNRGLFSQDFIKLYYKATTTLTDLESIRLYNELVDDEDEIIGVYEISKEVYAKKNSIYIDPEDFERFIGDEYEEDIDCEE